MAITLFIDPRLWIYENTLAELYTLFLKNSLISDNLVIKPFDKNIKNLILPNCKM